MKHFLFGLLVRPGLVAASGCNDLPTAVLDSGPVVGVETSLPGGIAPVNKFLGIPYAESPERFSKSQVPKKWHSPRSATKFGPACTQFIVCGGVAPGCDVQNGLFNANPPPESEDCLYLNAFAPNTPGPRAGRPVVLFIHGGGFQLGHGRIDLSGFAAYEDIVAFSFNYRTNIFGFPNSPDIPVTERNLGLFDQQMAIEWAQRNAAAFGGDPLKVTIWGESAGAISTDAKLHVYAQANPPPFRGAIMMSGQQSFGLFGSPGNASNPGPWDAAAAVVGCAKKDSSDQLACMRKVPAKALINALQQTGTGFMPIVDEVTLPSRRAEAWRKGKIAKVPIMVTSIAEEGRGLIDRTIQPEMFEMVYLPDGIVTKKQKDQIFSYYESRPGKNTTFDVLSSIYTDFLLQCPTNLIAETSASIGNPTWRAYFNISVTNMTPKKFEFLGKYHGSDVALLFKDPVLENIKELTAVQVVFGTFYRGAIGRFVKSPKSGPGWPAVGSKYEPLDVVTLGDVGDAHSGGATPVNQTKLDEACAMYAPSYPIIEQVIP